MANSLGALIVQLGLDAAQFVDGLTKSEAKAQRFSANLQNQIAVGVLKAEIALKALGAAAKLAVDAFPELTEQAGKWQNISERLGDTAANMASLAVAAKRANQDVDELADFSAKLQKNMTLAGDASSKTGAVLKALGIDARAFKELRAADQFEALAKALATFNEEGKTAALEDLVKGGSKLLPFLKELGDGVGRVNILTDEQIRLARDYADRHAQSREQLKLHAEALTTQLIPALTVLEESTTDVIKELLGLGSTSKDLKNNRAVRDFAEEGAKSIATLADAAFALAQSLIAVGRSYGAAGAIIAAVTRGDFAQAKQIIKDAREEGDKMKFSLGLRDKVDANFSAQAAQEDPYAQFEARRNAGKLGAKKTLNYTGVDENASDVLKKQLEGQLKTINDFLKQQRDGYEFANQYLKGVYDDGLTSLADYIEKQKALRDADVQSQIKALDAEIAALQAYKAKALKPQERIDADNKIAEAVRKRADVVSEAGRKEILANQQNARAVRDLSDAYNEFRAQILELSGDSFGAASLRIAKTVRDTRELLTKSGKSTSEADEQERLLTIQASKNELQRQYGILVEAARTKEETATLDAQLAGKSELETLMTIAGIRRDSLTNLEALADAAKRLSESLPGNVELRQVSDQMQLAYKKAFAEVDPLLVKIQDTGKEIGGTIASGIEDWIVGAKSLRQVLASIEQDILRIMTRKLITEPLTNWLSSVLGGNGTSSGGGGLIGKLIGKLIGAGGSSFQAAFSQTSLGASGFGTGLAYGNLDFGGFLAGGGVTEPNRTYRVNERGPEMLDVNGQQFLMMGNQRGRVTPIADSVGGGTVVFNISVPAGTTEETSYQIATRANEMLSRLRRG